MNEHCESTEMIHEPSMNELIRRRPERLRVRGRRRAAQLAQSGEPEPATDDTQEPTATGRRDNPSNVRNRYLADAVKRGNEQLAKLGRK
jgi:hypothetical protein